MIRRDGRATPGQRVVDHGPDNYGPNQTMVAALGLHGLEAPWGVDSASNGEIFHCWVSEVLGPTLQPGDIVLWDNLSAHKVAGEGRTAGEAGRTAPPIVALFARL
jgi:hypothetical protein